MIEWDLSKLCSERAGLGLPSRGWRSVAPNSPARRRRTNTLHIRLLPMPIKANVLSAYHQACSCQLMGCPVDENSRREEFDTALARIRHDIKGRLVVHGFFGTVTYKDIEAADHVLDGSTIEITVKGRAVERTFSRQEIEACRLRVSGAVLSGVISMVEELSA
jgi:hypothetical protein